jgi:POT family proton-dependent oligopeptide transporter
VFYGGCLIALGNLTIALPLGFGGFVTGLAFNAIGTGLLKPNVSTMVGSCIHKVIFVAIQLSLFFYMGINLGAFLSPLIAGYFGQRINWHIGFGVVAFGMVLGLIQYKLGAKHLGDAGLYIKPTDPVVDQQTTQSINQ